MKYTHPLPPVNDPARRGALRALSALAALPGLRPAWAAEGLVLDELLMHQVLSAGLTALWWRWRLSNDAPADSALQALATG